MHHTILLTGFGPFGANDENPSQAVCQTAERIHLPGIALHTCVLPVAYARCERDLCAALEHLRPAALLSLGLAAASDQIVVERFALDIDDAEAPDIDGECRIGVPIRADGPQAYRATVPIERMLAALIDQEIPARISNHAGGYLCNHCFYTTCDWAARNGGTPLVGFAHIPPTPAQVASHEERTGMPLERTIEATRLLLQAITASLDAK